MPHSLSILMAQINPTVGAVSANLEKILHIIQQHQHNHDLIIFSELTLTGYPPDDLLFRKELFFQVDKALQSIKAKTEQCHVVVGHPSIKKGQCYNSASVFAHHERVALYHIQHLPNYGDSVQ